MILSQFRSIFSEKLIPLYGVDEVQSFFRIIVDHYLGLQPVDLVLQKDKKLTESELYQLNNAQERLQKEEPIQYILGETEFYGLSFKVTPDVLIPRPETEELVAWVLESLKNRKLKTHNSESVTILDIGTGSGCIAISLAKQLPNAKVYAIDVSTKALAVAKENAAINKVSIEFIIQDILKTAELPRIFDIVVSNPPYVRMLEQEEMQKNVLDNEPALALYVSDTDPLVFYKKIAALAAEKLSKNGLLFFEINQYLGQEMHQLLETENFEAIELKKDLFGADRMIKGKKGNSHHTK